MKVRQFGACEWRIIGEQIFRLLIHQYFLMFVLTLCLVGTVRAEQKVYTIDLPAQTVARSLNKLSEQTGVPVFFPYDLASNRQANPVSGSYTLLQALDILLEGTGLSGGLSEKGVVMISLSESPARELNEQDQEGEEVMPKQTGFFSKLSAFIVSAFAATQGVPAQGSGGAIEEVVVTAQKRAESIQDVPITMDAFSGEQLQSRQIKKADDVIKLAPNITFNYSNDINTSISIRGVGTDNFHGNVNRAVGIYYDEIYMATPYSGTLGVYDLERIEVLRGPQNTLFGRNTTGGAIQYISKKPDPGQPVEGYARATYGRFDQIDFEGAVSIPLGETAAARVSAQTVNRDGPFTNLAPGRVGEELGQIERHSARALLAWELTDTTSALLNFQVGFNRSDSRGAKARGTRDPNDPTQVCPELVSSANFSATNSCVSSSGFNPSTNEWDTLFNVGSAAADVDVWGGSLNIEHDFGWASITSLSSFYKTKVKLGDDITGIDSMMFVPHQDSTFEDYSQELRLTSPDDQPFRWILGAFYFREDLLQGTQVRRDANGGATVPGAEVTAFNILDQKDEDISIYGQMDADFTDRLTLTAGLRYTNNKKSADSQFGIALTPTATVPNATFISRDLVLELTEGAGACPPPPVPCRVPLLTPSQETNEVGVKVGFNYRFTDRFMGYAHYSRGFKSGGFDTRALAAFAGTADQPVAEEVLDTFEVGFKSDLLNNTLRLNAAAFYYVWEDQQVFDTINSIPGFVNIPESELLGFESTIRWTPGSDWLIQADIGILDSEVTDSGVLGGIDEGHDLKYSPSFTFNGMIAKDFLIAGNVINIQTNFRYVDEMKQDLSFDKDFLTTHPDQFYIDARASYDFGSNEQYQIAVFGENLTSEKHCFERDLQDEPLAAAPAPVTSTITCSPNVGEAIWGVTGTIRF